MIGEPKILTNGPIRMDLTTDQVFVGDELLKLSPKEFAFLERARQPHPDTPAISPEPLRHAGSAAL